MEWRLNPVVCRAIFVRLDRPYVDLFASSHSIFFHWEEDEQAFAFPPIALIPRVLLKFFLTQDCVMFLIATMWPHQLCFPRLVELLIAEPVRLPIRPDLLSNQVLL